MKNLRVYNSSEQYESMLDNIVVPAISRILTDQSHKVRWLNDNYYDDKYLTTTARESGTITFTMYADLTVANFTRISYSLDNGTTWTTATNVASTEVPLTTPTLQAGDKVIWKGYGIRMNTNTSDASELKPLFSATCDFDVSGNILSLLFEDNFTSKFSTTNTSAFSGLFKNCTHLINAENILLPKTLTNYCFFGMFYECSNLVTTPKLRAMTIPTGGYASMFGNCTSLITAPELPALTIGNYAYSYMFYNTGITKGMTLPATSMGTYCYQYMFAYCDYLSVACRITHTTLSNYACFHMYDNCASLTNVPDLTATTIGNYSYGYMFNNCNKLVDAPKIYAMALGTYACALMFYNCSSLVNATTFAPTTLNNYCCSQMFRNCTKLVNTFSILPAMTLKPYCYYEMFTGCSSLLTAPRLPATEPEDRCYYEMFSGCSKLNHIEMMLTDLGDATDYRALTLWVYSVQTTQGVLRMNSAAQWYKRGISGIPKNWIINYEQITPGTQDIASNYMNTYISQRNSERDGNYFYTEALASGTITLNIPASVSASHYPYVEWSKDKINWTRTTNNSSAKTINVSVSSGDKVYWRGPMEQPWCSHLAISDSKYSRFTSTCNFNIGGKIISLIDGNIMWDDIDVYNYYGYTFCRLFYNNTYLINAENLILAQNTCSYVYSHMFDGCTNLFKIPELCSSNEVNTGAYQYMFQNCTSIVSNSKIRATKAYQYAMCYMFSGCSSLTSSEDISVTNCGGTYTFNAMFKNCTSLTSTPKFAPTTLSNYCCDSMFMGCTALTTVMSELPATTLATCCYQSMFKGCTNITTAPILKATAWKNYCYRYMFQNCSSLNYIKCMATTAPTTSNHTNSWVDGVSATGTFVRNTTNWTSYGVSSIPSGWTVQSA